MTPDIPEANVTIRNRLLQLSGNIEAGEGFEPQCVGKKGYCGGRAAPRFGGRGARVLQQELWRRCVLAENGNAGVGCQMKLRLPYTDRLAQAGAQLRDAVLDLTAIRRLQNDRQQVVAELPQIPGKPTAVGGILRGQPEDRRAHDLFGDAWRNDLRDVGNAINVDHRNGNGLFAQGCYGHRLPEAPQKTSTVQLRAGALI